MFKKPDAYQIIIILLSIAVVASLGFLIYNQQKGTLGRAALSVDVEHAKASVTVNGTVKGETPFYREDLTSGDIEVTINGETNNYSTIIRPAAGTKAIVKRDLGVSQSFGSGQNVWFTKSSQAGQYVSVISPDVESVQVIVDGVEVGKTPVKFSPKDLLSQSAENKYKISFKKDGYEEQEVEVKLSDGYELNIRADLFLNPIPKEVESLSGLPTGVNFINFAKASNPAFADKQSWAKAVNYWLKTRGAVNLGNYKIEDFDFFIGDNGKFYNKDGNEVSATEVKLEAEMFVAYLGSPQTAALSDEAKKAIEEATGAKVTDAPVASANGSVKIADTGIGFLRVRDTPSTSGTEVSRVDVGKTFPIVKEQAGWIQIEYEAGKQGWVSGQYAKKVVAETPAQ